MDLMRTIGAMAAIMIVAAHAKAAPGTSSLEIMDVRIADAKAAETSARKAQKTICYNAGFATGQRDRGLPNNASEQLRQCDEASRASNDAGGLVGDLYEQRSHLTGQPMPREYACRGKPSLGAPQKDRMGNYIVCPKNPDDHSYKFWIITQARMQVGSAKETWSDGGLISIRRYTSESECRSGIAKYEDYPSKIPYSVKNGVIVGDVCVEVLIPDVRELPR